ncbi:MAG: 5'-methylthioadenosine/adenosylhomocysteine nucleosidase [Oscillospiraceae bacterium]|nr:5'-methylthioadenosine/adenosylhomocysteine nucleosidase [Oscillospiraceae bacterium]
MNVIGIIGAMPSELADIRGILVDARVEKKAGYDFYINEREGKTLINVCCGIAKVNAAVCAQVLIDIFHVDAIINTGIAGGLDDDIKVCDIVISNEVISHDLDLHFLNDYPPYCGIYKADSSLIGKAQEICSEMGIKTHIGRIVSGEAFISSNEVRNEIKGRLTPMAVDMESAAIGQCAYRNETPFVSIRCISDNADNEGAMSFDKFEKIAAKIVADVVLKLVHEL